MLKNNAGNTFSLRKVGGTWPIWLQTPLSREVIQFQPNYVFGAKTGRKMLRFWNLKLFCTPQGIQKSFAALKVIFKMVDDFRPNFTKGYPFGDFSAHFGFCPKVFPKWARMLKNNAGNTFSLRKVGGTWPIWLKTPLSREVIQFQPNYVFGAKTGRTMLRFWNFNSIHFIVPYRERLCT